MKSVVHKHQHVTKLAQVKDEICEEWKGISQSIIYNVILTFQYYPHRVIETEQGQRQLGKEHL